MDQYESYCEILVDMATERMKATDAFADWEKKSKGNRPLSDADRLRLNDLEKEVDRSVEEGERKVAEGSQAEQPIDRCLCSRKHWLFQV